MPNNRTDAEVKKALEYRLKVDGGTRLDKELLDLINRLEEEKQNLKIELQAMRNAANGFKAEVERLSREYFTYKIRWAKATAKLETTKAEAYKECIEKVKEHSNKMELVCSGALVRTDYTITKESLDNLLKEFERKENTIYDD